jgi:hypothetical protein
MTRQVTCREALTPAEALRRRDCMLMCRFG